MKEISTDTIYGTIDNIETRQDTYVYINKKITTYDIIKRLIDIVLATTALITSFPLFLLIIILIRFDSKGAAIYTHKRVGINGKELLIYKFRSMIVTDKPLEELLTPEQLLQYKTEYKVDNDPRITKIGHFLRKTSLDELPQLINIIKGELSIVGPRPVLQEETEKYGDKRDLFLSVTPGLTGYWQANGRSNTTYEERMEMELFYIKNRSLKFDFKIILATVKSVLTKNGAK